MTRFQLIHVSLFTSLIDDDRDEAEKLRDEEEKILQSVTQTALITASEIAKGVIYTEPIKTSWRPPRHIQRLSEDDAKQFRRKKGISVEGENVPYAIGSFCVGDKSDFNHQVRKNSCAILGNEVSKSYTKQTETKEDSMPYCDSNAR